MDDKIKRFTTDQLYETLPSFINVGGDLYFLRISKGQKRTSVEYINCDNKFLDGVYRTGKDLKSALFNMVHYLKDYGYYEKMASGSRLQKIIDKYYPTPSDDIVEIARKYALRCDTETNHLYDG